MKKFLLLLMTGLLCFSCQKDETTVLQNPVTGLSKSAPLAMLISRVTQNETHCDDILDDSNCYSIKLPVTLTIDGHQLTINSESDYDAVEAIMHQSNADDDVVHFVFPLTVVFAAFNELTVTSQQQLNSISCGDDDFNEIRCINFNFPVSINTYNTATQVARVVSIENDTQLYDFITNAATSDLFSIAYPLTVTLSNGQTLSISSNNELENAIEDSIDDCDNDDHGPGTESQQLSAYIANGTWRVTYCNDSSDYNGYNFTFLSNGTLTAVKSGNVSSGIWQLFDDAGHLKMKLAFDNPALNGLENDEWKVTEYNTTNFRLKEDHHGGGNGGGESETSGGGNDYVYFTKN